MDVLCVGEMLIDFLPGEGEGVYIRKAGGAPANVAIATARQGCSAEFVGMLGNDDFGRFLRDTLIENGVRYEITELTDEATTTMSFVTLSADGDRSFTFARKPGADTLLKVSDITDDMIGNAKIVHAGGCSLSMGTEIEATEYAMREANRSGKLVSFDVNYRNVMWHDDAAECAEAVRRVLPYVDFMKISDEEADMFGGEQAIPELMKQYGISLLMETLGSKGARCYWNGQMIELPGLKAKAVDTCGAGDSFWGGFLATIIRSGLTKTSELTAELIDEAMKTGNIAGWLCVQKKGAIESLPVASEVEKYRKELY